MYNDDWDDSPSNQTNIRTIAEFIDNEFFMESIKEQIYEGLDCNSVNYLEELKIKIEEVYERFDESDYQNLIIFQEDLYRNIINWLEDKYNIEVQYDDNSLQSIAEELYSFFVINLKDITTYFLIFYIIENYSSILKEIPEDRLNKQILEKLKADADEEKYLTVSNIEEFITQIGHMDFDVETFLRYASMSGDIEILNGNSSYNEDSVQRDWNLSEDNEMVSSIIRQVANGEYDRSMVLNITDTLMNAFNIVSQLDENK